MRSLRRALWLPWHCAPLLAAVQLLATVAAGLVPVATANLTAALIDRLGAGDHGGSAAGWLTGAAIGATAGGALLQHANRYSSRELARRVDVRIQQDLFESVTACDDLAQLENPGFHNQVRLAQQAATAGPQQLVSTVLSILQGGITTTGFLVSCLIFAPIPTMLLLVSAVPEILAQRRLSRMRARTTAAAAPHFRRQLFYVQLLLDLRAAKEIRLFGLGARFLRRLRAETAEAQSLDRAVDRATLRTDAGLSILTALVSGAALGIVVFDIAHGRGRIGDLAVLVAALAGVQTGLAGIVAQIASLSQTLILFGYYTALVDHGPAPVPERAPEPRAPALEPREGIRFHDVWFRYDASADWVLRGLDLQMPPHTVVGLVGLNGAGKSTIAKLLCRLYAPTRGRITWDGEDLCDIPVDRLRSRITAVFQDFMAYDLTAHDNIAVAASTHAADAEAGFGVARTEVVAAASAAGAHELLSVLPRGYDSMLSRIFADDSTPGAPAAIPGAMLSGGQWQRVALARAAMRGDARLFILDEPSASLDPQAEAAQRERLRALLAGRIGLLISHRLDSIRQAGLIVVLRDGAVAEQGTHDELLAHDGEYARLFRLQARGFLDTAQPLPGSSGTTSYCAGTPPGGSGHAVTTPAWPPRDGLRQGPVRAEGHT